MPNEQKLKQTIIETIQEYLKSAGFNARKVTDTPTDALAVVNRQFVTLNGLTAARPAAPVTGQFYYDTTIGKPIWWNGTNWKDATGATV